VNQKFFEVSSVHVNLIVGFVGEPRLNSSLDCGVYLGRTEIEFDSQSVIGPGLFAPGDEFQEDEDIL
jgi:hypothetical protein